MKEGLPEEIVRAVKRVHPDLLPEVIVALKQNLKISYHGDSEWDNWDRNKWASMCNDLSEILADGRIPDFFSKLKNKFYQVNVHNLDEDMLCYSWEGLLFSVVGLLKTKGGFLPDMSKSEYVRQMKGEKVGSILKALQKLNGVLKQDGMVYSDVSNFTIPQLITERVCTSSNDSVAMKGRRVRSLLLRDANREMLDSLVQINFGLIIEELVESIERWGGESKYYHYNTDNLPRKLKNKDKTRLRYFSNELAELIKSQTGSECWGLLAIPVNIIFKDSIDEEYDSAGLKKLITNK